jgi:4-hydroxythreonine-4-phosphate dehydrogenase
VIGDRRVFDRGAEIACVRPDIRSVSPDDPLEVGSWPEVVDLGHLDPATVEQGVAAIKGGFFALKNFRHALTMAKHGQTDTVCFTPVNKKAMRLAHPPYDHEISFSAEVIGITSPQASSTFSTGCGTPA